MPEAGYYNPDAAFVPALVVLAAVVAAFVAYTLVGRFLYERRRARLEKERRRVDDLYRRLGAGPPREELGDEVERVLADVGSTNKVVLVGMIGGLEEPARSAYLGRVTRYEGWKSLIRRALRSPFKWRRVEAIGILGGLDIQDVIYVLSRCLEDRDDDVVYAAARPLSRQPDLRAAAVLLDLFGENRLDPKRLVAMLEAFPAPTHEILWPRLEDPDPETRVRAATLLGASDEPSTVPRLVRAASDDDPDVRSASVRSLADIGDGRGKEVLPGALGDRVWFVRASAARLAGALGATDLAGDLVGLLGDGNWWVRQNAKTALIALCPEAEVELERHLDSEDRFVRNMVAEVLDASGDGTAPGGGLEEDPDSGPARLFFLRLIVAEGRGSVGGSPKGGAGPAGGAAGAPGRRRYPGLLRVGLASSPVLIAVIYWAYVSCMAYYVVINVYYLVLFAFAASENRLRVGQQRFEDFRALSRSRHTLPVSVIVPGFNEEQTISDCLYSLGKLDYPQYEVIMVNDGSSDRTLDVLIDEFDLDQVDIFSRRHFDTAGVRGVYRSRRYDEFYVIDKANGGKADSLNAGINFSRYPYVCTCDADTIFAPQSLLKAMRVVMRDPQRALAVGSLIGINNGYEIVDGEILSTGLPREAIVSLQLIEYLRSFLLNRLAWTRMNFMMVVSGAFAIYRRDVLIELGGFSKDFTCEDIEMTFRVHEFMRREKRPYRIVSLPEAVSWTEAPENWMNLYRQRHRWQRVICETFWAYRRMFLNPRYGAVGLVGMPYYLFGEVLPWVPELLALVIIPLALALGVFSWWPLLTFIGIFVLTNVLISVMGIMLQDVGFRPLTMRQLVRLILLSFIESFGYRQLLSWSRFAGTIAFFRGEKGWQKFARVERKGPPSGPRTPFGPDTEKTT